MSDLWQLVFTLVVLAVVAEAVAILALARAIGVIQLRIGPPAPALQTIDGLAVSAAAPDVSGFDLRSGRDITLNVSKAGRWAVVFVSATCSVCRDVVSELGQARREDCLGATLVLVGRGTADQNLALHKSAPDLAFVCDPLGAVHAMYAVDVAPFVSLIENGRVAAKGIVNSRAQIELLVETKRAFVPLSPETKSHEPAIAEA